MTLPPNENLRGQVVGALPDEHLLAPMDAIVPARPGLGAARPGAARGDGRLAPLSLQTLLLCIPQPERDGVPSVDNNPINHLARERDDLFLFGRLWSAPLVAVQA